MKVFKVVYVYSDTPGKQYFYTITAANKESAKTLAEEQIGCMNSGVKFEILVPEETDVSLPERCRRANVIHADCGNNAVLFSVHGNAGGGTGWECYTSVGQTKADAIATVLCKEAEKEFAPDGWKMRFDYYDGDPDKESQFYILKHTVCPAVLSENFFFDNEKDCRFMMSDDGKERIAKVHFEAIKKIV